MNKIKIVMTILIVIGLATGLVAREPEGFVPRPMAKASLNQTGRTMSNISNWGYWMYSSGKSAQKPNGNSGGVYPRGTAGAIYQDGLVWGGKFAGAADDIRLGGCTYSVGTVGGWINADGTAASPSDERVKIWRIRPDWETLTYDQVKTDAMELNELGSAADVTDAMCQAVIDQYEEDWKNWPADLGAPVYEDGTPGIADADQVVWYVTNDLDRTACLSLGGSEPMGIELQVTVWAYAQPGARLGQIIFKKYKFINKSGQDITDMYVSQWCDPDLGSAADDYVGCDTTLSLGYAYNSTPTDGDYDAFGLAPAAVGYDFFQGPTVDGIAGQDLNRNGIDDAEDHAVFNLEVVGPGKVNLPMSSFGWFAAGSAISDPTLGEYEGTLQWYNLMQGYVPTDDIDNPTPWTLGNIEGNPTTKYPMAGDPVTGSGYIDGQDSYQPPGDRRLCLTSGPFNMSNGEEQEVVVAVLGGMGDNNLSSVTDLKLTDIIAQDIYNNAFAGIPKAPKGPEVTIVPFEDQVMLEWGSNSEAVKVSEEPQIAGYTFEGYNVYQLPSASSGIDDALKVATYDVANGITTIMGKKFLAEYGAEVEVPVQQGFDNGVQRFFKIDKDYITGKPLYEGKTYYFAVTAYNYNPAPALIEAKSLESAMIGQSVIVQDQLPGDMPNVEILSDIEVTHTVGSAGGSASGTVVNPMATTGHDYEVFFDKQVYYRDGDGLWKEFVDGQSKLSKAADITDSEVTGSAIYAETVGEVDLMVTYTYGSSTGAWIDGFELILPEGVIAKSATITDGAFSNNLNYGQVDLALEGMIDGNKVSWGDSLRSGIGAIEGNMYFKIVLDANDVSLPFAVEYSVWDDNYAAPLADELGTLTITEIGYDFSTMSHWNVKDKTSGSVVLEDQFVISGHTVDHIEAGRMVTGGGVGNSLTFDGVQLSLDVLYTAPTDYAKYTHVRPDGSTDVFSGARATAWLNYDQHGKPYIITSYLMQNWAGGARTFDTEGFGTTDVNYLQRDYELRFTGVYDDPITANGQTYHPIKEGTGSKAILFRARSGELSNHPDPNNPGDGTPFFVNIPFEVWDMEAEGGPRQVSILLTDRLQKLADGEETYAFNPADRMYCEFLMVDYATVIAGNAADFVGSDMATWNTVFWNCDWTTGDVVKFEYDNPIQFGIDSWEFSTVAPTLDDEDLAKDAVKEVNVFPNPYYANNDLSTTRFDDYVTFTHLPEKAEIRIFNLAGIQVIVLEKDDPSQFLKWNLQNAAGLPVGSGMYIAHIDMPDLGKEKVLKMVIITKEQILEYY